MLVPSGVPCGKIAFDFLGRRYPLQVLQSHRGFYLGTADECGPVSRESEEYWPTSNAAQAALEGDPSGWTQRGHP